jgi:hypothetical protein
MKENKIAMWIIVLILLIVDWLTFHDFMEPHTIRDWLTLFASILVFTYFVGPFKAKK